MTMGLAAMEESGVRGGLGVRKGLGAREGLGGIEGLGGSEELCGSVGLGGREDTAMRGSSAGASVSSPYNRED